MSENHDEMIKELTEGTAAISAVVKDEESAIKAENESTNNVDSDAVNQELADNNNQETNEVGNTAANENTDDVSNNVSNEASNAVKNEVNTEENTEANNNANSEEAQEDTEEEDTEEDTSKKGGKKKGAKKKEPWTSKVSWKEILENIDNFEVDTEVPADPRFKIIDVLKCSERDKHGLSLFVGMYLQDKYIAEAFNKQLIYYKYNGVYWEEDEQRSLFSTDTNIIEILRSTAIALQTYCNKMDIDYRSNNPTNPDAYPYNYKCEKVIDRLFHDIHVFEGTPNYKRFVDRAASGDSVLKINSLIIPSNKFDNDREELTTPEGIVNLLTGEIRDSSPSDYIRRCTPTTYISYEELNMDYKKTLWYKTIKDIFKPLGYPEPLADLDELNNEDKIKMQEKYEEDLSTWKTDIYSDIAFDYLQIILGYMMLGTNPLQKFFMAIGESGRNGKGLIEHTLKEVFGEDYIASSGSESFLITKYGRAPGSASPDLMRLKYPRIMFIEESNKNVELDSALIKKITGGDPLTVRPLYGQLEEFKPQAVPFFVTNYNPYFDVYDTALEARCCRIPFLRRFVDESEMPDDDSPYYGLKDINTEKNLLEEREFILSWIVEGALKFAKSKTITIPDIFKVYTEKYRKSRDILQTFIDTYCNVDDKAKCKKTTLYSIYKIFLKESGLNQCSNRTFYENLEKKKYRFSATNGTDYVRGLELNQDALYRLEEIKERETRSNFVDLSSPTFNESSFAVETPFSI